MKFPIIYPIHPYMFYGFQQSNKHDVSWFSTLKQRLKLHNSLAYSHRNSQAWLSILTGEKRDPDPVEGSPRGSPNN